MITTVQAAKRKGCSVNAVNLAIKRGALEAIREGRFWLVDEDHPSWREWKPGRWTAPASQR